MDQSRRPQETPLRHVDGRRGFLDIDDVDIRHQRQPAPDATSADRSASHAPTPLPGQARYVEGVVGPKGRVTGRRGRTGRAGAREGGRDGAVQWPATSRSNLT